MAKGLKLLQNHVMRFIEEMINFNLMNQCKQEKEKWNFKGEMTVNLWNDIDSFLKFSELLQFVQTWHKNILRYGSPLSSILLFLREVSNYARGSNFRINDKIAKSDLFCKNSTSWCYAMNSPFRCVDFYKITPSKSLFLKKNMNICYKYW